MTLFVCFRNLIANIFLRKTQGYLAKGEKQDKQIELPENYVRKIISY